jgi:hypothetical protein
MLSARFQFFALTLPCPGLANKLVAPQKLKVNFLSETKNGLVLCPSDIDPSNFIIDTTGKVFAIDFGRTGYMPTSFVSYSLTMSSKPFTRMVARLIKYPKSSNLRAMGVAAGLLVISGKNSLGSSHCRSCLAARH